MMAATLPTPAYSSDNSPSTEQAVLHSSNNDESPTRKSKQRGRKRWSVQGKTKFNMFLELFKLYCYFF